MIVEVERNKLFIVIYIVETYTPEIPLTPWKQVLKKEIEPGVSKSVLQLVILLKREEKWYCVWEWMTKSQVMYIWTQIHQQLAIMMWSCYDFRVMLWSHFILEISMCELQIMPPISFILLCYVSPISLHS